MTFNILRITYFILFIVLLPFIFLRLMIKSIKLPAYRYRWHERLGFCKFRLKNSIWIHAVSVGEAISAIPLVYNLQKKYPNVPIVITTMTPTGSDRIKAAFSKVLNQSVFHVYVPYDIPFAIQSFLNNMDPKLLILMETEIWPNIITLCYQRKVKIMIANARLSPHSLKYYKMGGLLIKNLINKINIIAAQSQIDLERFIEIGAKSDTVKNIGNIKFDMHWPSDILIKGQALRTQLGNNRNILIAASTHEGEELIMLRVYKQLKLKFPNLLLLIVPRHPERFQKVMNLCEMENLKVIKRTDAKICSIETDVFLGDTMGEMGVFYAASDIAFVGGSLVPIGGHNLLEPAALGLPILTGPYLHNFVYISDVLLEAQGATLVDSEISLINTLSMLLSDPLRCREQGQIAFNVIEKHKGALDNLVKIVDDLF